MPTLVRVPYQPEYLGTPQAVALLLKACSIAGHNIPIVDGWRPYQYQKDLYLGYRAGLPGYNLASNPDDPNAQNNHLRGEAWDVKNTSDGAAMLAAGFTRDAVEPWHFNEPNWRNMPIIKDTTGLASSTAVLIEEEEDMSYSLVKDAKSATIYVCSLVTGNRMGVASPYHVTLLDRFRKNSANDPMLVAELDICRSYLQVINPTAAVSGGSAGLSAADKAALVKAINDDAANRLAS